MNIKIEMYLLEICHKELQYNNFNKNFLAMEKLLV